VSKLPEIVTKKRKGGDNIAKIDKKCDVVIHSVTKNVFTDPKLPEIVTKKRKGGDNIAKIDKKCEVVIHSVMKNLLTDPCLMTIKIAEELNDITPDSKVTALLTFWNQTNMTTPAVESKNPNLSKDLTIHSEISSDTKCHTKSSNMHLWKRFENWKEVPFGYLKTNLIPNLDIDIDDDDWEKMKEIIYVPELRNVDEFNVCRNADSECGNEIVVEKDIFIF
jgi:hypothetical protein